MFTRLSIVALLGLGASIISASPVKRDSILPVREGASYTPDDTSIPGRRIRLQDRPDLCLTVQGGYAAYGVNVEISGCFADHDTFTDMQLFDVTRPSRGPIPLTSKPNLCLDAGDYSNGAGIFLQECEEGKESQQFTLGTTGSGSNPNLRAEIGSTNQCLDVDVNSSPSYQKPYVSTLDLQVWECHPIDTPDNNQWIALL